MSDIHGASGSYVTHALELSEQAEFEAHLAECETCAREVAGLRETVAEMSAVSAVAPPPALKSQVMSEISGVRVLPPLATPTQPRSAGDLPDELARRRQRRTTRLLSFAVAASLLIALGLGGWVVALTQHQAPASTASMEAQLLRAPDLKAYTLQLKDGGTGTFIASKSLNRAMFSSADLPALKAGQAYQLWTVAGPLTAPTRVTPDALVSGGGPVKAWFTGPVAESDALGISIEQAGGASAPTNMQAGTMF